MTLQDIACFMKVAETLNYTKAAEALYISQPAVTKHIHALEQELGGELIDRSVRRAIQLTDIGKLYYEGLRQCAEIYEDTMRSIELHTEKAEVLINLMRGTTFPDSFIQATTRFMEEHPTFHHFANFIEYRDFSTVLDRGEILICSEELMPYGKSYQTMKLNDDSVPYYIVASAKHKAFSDAEDVSLNEIAKTTLFLPKMLPKSMREKLYETMTPLLGTTPKEVIFLDSADSVSLFLRSNECFTICSGWHNDAKSSDFKAIPIPLFTNYFAVWHSERLKNPEALAYLRALRASEWKQQ